MSHLLSSLRGCFLTMLLAILTLSGCQSIPHGLSPEQIAVLRQQGFDETDEGWAYDLSGKVLFGSDLDGLNTESKVIVDRIGKALLSVGIVNVRVDGHADASGQASYNQQLSERRARSVGNELIAIGMPAHNIKTQGLGSSHPVADNRTSAGRMENRRVSIVVASN